MPCEERKVTEGIETSSTVPGEDVANVVTRAQAERRQQRLLVVTSVPKLDVSPEKFKKH